MSTKIKEETIQEQHLIVSVPDEAQSQPVAPIQWCISQEMQKRIREEQISSALVLIVIVRNNRNVDRVIAPLSDAMRYLQFTSSGKHTISIALLGIPLVGNHEPFSEEKVLKKQLLDKNSQGAFLQSLTSDVDGSLITENLQEICDYEGHYSGDYIRINAEILAATQFDITIADAQFASKGSALVWKLVNSPYSTSPLDQCVYRKRLLLSVVVIPICIAFAGFIFSLVTIVRVAWLLILLLLGYWRGLNLKSLWNFDEFNPGEISEDSENVFFTTPTGASRPLVIRLFIPIIPLMVFGGVFFVMKLNETFTAEDFWRVGLGSLLGISIIGMIVVKTTAFITDYHKKLLEKDNQAEEERRIHKFDNLVCTGKPLTRKVKDLKNPSFSVRFQALKAKVCKTYSQG